MFGRGQFAILVGNIPYWLRPICEYATKYHVAIEANLQRLQLCDSIGKFCQFLSCFGKFITLYGDSVLVMAKLQLCMYAYTLGSLWIRRSY